jgi:hypothetical protein
MEMMTMANDLKHAKEEAVKKLLLGLNGNVVGVGIGKKDIHGQETPCLRVYVVEVIREGDLRHNPLVLPDLGVPTDVIEVGRFGRKGHPPKLREDTTPRPGSPIRVKTNAPNVNEGFIGTLGAVVKNGDNDQYILSCNHILAVNGRVPKHADIVSAEFVGTEQTIAKPGRFIEFQRDGNNSVDCAVAPTLSNTVQATFPAGFALSPGGPADPTPRMNVTKFGAATERTYGNIVDIDADLNIDYSFGTFRFDHQVIIESGKDNEPFATAGDSGSIVVDTSTNRAVAMIFAASGRFAVACPLQKVLDRFKEEPFNLDLSIALQ